MFSAEVTKVAFCFSLYGQRSQGFYYNLRRVCRRSTATFGHGATLMRSPYEMLCRLSLNLPRRHINR